MTWDKHVDPNINRRSAVLSKKKSAKLALSERWFSRTEKLSSMFTRKRIDGITKEVAEADSLWQGAGRGRWRPYPAYKENSGELATHFLGTARPIHKPTHIPVPVDANKYAIC